MGLFEAIFGVINTPVLISILTGLGVAGIGTLLGVKVFNKQKILSRSKKAEGKLRNYAKYNEKNPAQLKSMIKKYYQSKLKCASKGIALGIEKGTTQNTYKDRNPNHTIFSREKTMAELGLAKLQDKNSSKVKKLEEKLALVEFEQEIPYYAEKIIFDDKTSVELSTNSIITDSTNLLSEYKLALEPSLQNKYYDRKEGIGIYPMVTEIHDENDKTVMKLSDVSPDRYAEYSMKLFAKLYQKAEKNEQQGLDMTYKAYAYDSYAKGRKTSSNNRLDVAFDTKEKVKEAYKTLFVPFYKSFKDFKLTKSVGNFDELVEFYRYEDKLLNVKPNSIKFNSNSNQIVSNVLLNKFGKTIEKVKMNLKDPNQIVITLKIGQNEILTAVADTDELKFLTMPYLFAYAYVLAYDREQDGLVQNIAIDVVKVDLKNKKVEHINESSRKFSNAEQIYLHGKTYSQFESAVNEFAKEKNLHLQFESSQIQKPDKVQERQENKQDDFIVSPVNSTLEKFNQALMSGTYTVDQNPPYLTKFETKSNTINPRYKIDMAMATHSKKIQAEFFLELLIQSYAILKKENEENKKIPPLLVSVSWQRTIDEKTNRRNIENPTKTYFTIEEIKKEIDVFAKNNFKSKFGDKELENKILEIYQELYPVEKKEESSFSFL